MQKIWVQNPSELQQLQQQLQQKMLESEQRQRQLQWQMQREQTIASIMHMVEQRCTIQAISNFTISQVKALLQVDRAVVYQYQAEFNGFVLAEAVEAELPALDGFLVRSELISGKEWIARYQSGECCNISDISRVTRRSTSSLISEPVCVSESAVMLCQFFQIKAKLAVPIRVGQSLWGLLVVHQCLMPRQWQPDEIHFLRLLAAQLSVAVGQEKLLQHNQQLQQQLNLQAQEYTSRLSQTVDYEAMLKRITDRVRDSLDEHQILQTAMQELVMVLELHCCQAMLGTGAERGDGDGSRFVTYPAGSVDDRQLTDSLEYQQIDTEQLCQFCSIEPFLNSGRNAILVCPIFDDQEYLGSLRLYARRSRWFDDEEIRLVQQVASHCAIAIRQARLYQASQTQVQELEQLHQLKDDFLSTVSHELRTPLSSIKMVTNLLRLALNPDDSTASGTISDAQAGKITQYLKVLQEECDREISLVNDLLTIQHLNAGNHPLTLTTIQLQDWILYATETFYHRAQMQQQRFELQIPRELPSIVCDSFMLNRILVELLNNACKYTPSGELILVNVSIHAAQFRLTVSNTGIDIAPDQVDRIFDPFYRIPSNDPWKHSGTGLGLSLIKKLVEYLDGRIWVESGANQVHFFVELPISQLAKA